MLLPLSACLQIVVGGLNAYSDLDNAANFAAGVATGRECLYTHANGVIDQGQGGINAKVGQAWKGVPPGVAEFGVFPSGFFAANASYGGYWVKNGLTVVEANVNIDYSDPAILTKFEAFVDEGRSVGQIPNFAPVFSPNSTALYDGTAASLGTGFFDPKWDVARSAASYGGGIAFDTPPLFVVHSPYWYLQFVEQEIRWGNATGLRTSVIVSPSNQGASFLSDAQAFEKQLVADKAIPSQWVIETYQENADGTYPNDSNDPNPIGSENSPNTVAAVAKWFAQNAPVAVPDQGTTIVETVQGISVPVASKTKTDGSWRIQNADGSFGSYFVGAPDGSYAIEVTADLKGGDVYLYTAAGALIGTYPFALR